MNDTFRLYNSSEMHCFKITYTYILLHYFRINRIYIHSQKWDSVRILNTSEWDEIWKKIYHLEDKNIDVV